ADTPKSNVIGGALLLAFAAGRDQVANAIVFRAKERAPALHALGGVRLVGIQANKRPARVANGAHGVIVCLIAVAAPFPGVAGHVVEAVAVGWIRTDRRQAGEAIQRRVLVWKASLPN